jgi:hypothetical protein
MTGICAFETFEATSRIDVKAIGPANRCIVPATSFCEYADTKPRKTPKSRRRPTAVRLRRFVDALAGSARAKERADRGRA